MTNNQKLYGYVVLGTEKFAFGIDGFIGRIFDGISGIRFNEKIELPDVIYGVTDKNFNIAIRVRSSYRRTNCIIFGTDYYAIGTANLINYDLSKFDKIEFVGGTINSILDPSLIYYPEQWEDVHEQGCSINFKPTKEVEREYDLVVKDTALTFKSTINPYQNRKDNVLGVTNSCIILKFKESQPFASVDKWYSYVSKMAAILVRQQNVAFDRITISFGDNTNRGFARVSVNHGFENVVERSPIRTISIRCFDNVFSSFSQMIENDDFAINFLPDNNSSSHFVTYELVKNLCTAVEFEFEKSSIKKEKNSIIEALAQKVKKVIKDYRESTAEVTEKTYNMLLKDVSVWSFPATEKFNHLYNASKAIVDELASHKFVSIDEQAIQNFVTCRNEITHCGKPSLNEEIVNTAYGLQILIYVSAFKRIGLKDEEILDALRMVF